MTHTNKPPTHTQTHTSGTSLNRPLAPSRFTDLGSVQLSNQRQECENGAWGRAGGGWGCTALTPSPHPHPPSTTRQRCRRVTVWGALGLVVRQDVAAPPGLSASSLPPPFSSSLPRLPPPAAARRRQQCGDLRPLCCFIIAEVDVLRSGAIMIHQR